MNIGNGIKKVLTRKKVSQKELATVTGISETTISHVVSGKSKPTEDTLDKIANALDVYKDIFYYLGAEESEIPDDKKKLFQLIWGSLEATIYEAYSKEMNTGQS